MVVSTAFVNVHLSSLSLCFNLEKSVGFSHLPWVRRHKHTFPLEPISMPRITGPDYWAVNNITNIRACLDSAERVSVLLGPYQTLTYSNFTWEVMKVCLGRILLIIDFIQAVGNLHVADSSRAVDIRLGPESNISHKNVDLTWRGWTRPAT